MINASFFIEHSEVIGLWFIYAILMLLGWCVFETFYNWIVKKIKRYIKRKIMKKSIQEAIRLEKIQRARMIRQIRCSKQIRNVMIAEI